MLIRLYDSYHAAAPEKIGIAYSAEGLTDLTGYERRGGGRRPADLRRGVPARRHAPMQRTAAALRQAITDAGAAPLLHVGGSASALKDDRGPHRRGAGGRGGERRL